jgi:hypothetical protein
MKAGDRARCSTRRRRRLPVPLARVPTVFPVATPRRAKPKGGAFRAFLNRLRNRMHRFVFVPGSCAWMWRDGQTNPATGLGMYGGVDSAGNPYGVGSIHVASHRDWEAAYASGISSLPCVVIEHDSAWRDW